jgi:chromate transporter
MTLKRRLAPATTPGDLPSDHRPTNSVSLREFLLVWLRVAALSFGGPAGQIAVMHRILVEEKKWIDEQRFLHALNYCMLLPGPEAQQLATYVGWLMRGIPGGLVAGGLFVLPGFLSILALSIVYALYQETTVVQALFFGLQAAILAVVAEAVVRIGRRVLKNPAMVAIAGAAFVAIFFFRVPFPVVVIVAALIGLVGGWKRPDLFHVIKGHGGAAAAGEHRIDYLAAHTQPRLGRQLLLAVVMLSLWLAPLVALEARFPRGSQGRVFADECWFFSQVSLVTFGGAYAVLPYVADEAEHRYGWVTSDDVMAGLGMAETTPGPLIQVVQFVGFLGAYKAYVSDGQSVALSAGIAGALIVNWVTYLPCFLWIFLGAPYIERLRGQKDFSAALSAVTAAVVGVVLNLAVWFTLKALFGPLAVLQYGPLRLHVPQWFATGDTPYFSFATLGLSAAAAVALFRYKRGVIEVLLVSCAAGAVLYTLGAR